MTRSHANAARLAACAAALLLCGTARAQRNGDVSRGLDNQPTRGEVRGRERADGVAPSPTQQRRGDGTVDTLYRDLMRKERSDGMAAAPAGPAPTGPAPTGPRP